MRGGPGRQREGSRGRADGVLRNARVKTLSITARRTATPASPVPRRASTPFVCTVQSSTHTRTAVTVSRLVRDGNLLHRDNNNNNNYNANRRNGFILRTAASTGSCAYTYGVSQSVHVIKVFRVDGTLYVHATPHRVVPVHPMIIFSSSSCVFPGLPLRASCRTRQRLKIKIKKFKTLYTLSLL